MCSLGYYQSVNSPMATHALGHMMHMMYRISCAQVHGLSLDHWHIGNNRVVVMSHFLPVLHIYIYIYIYI